MILDKAREACRNENPHRKFLGVGSGRINSLPYAMWSSTFMRGAVWMAEETLPVVRGLYKLIHAPDSLSVEERSLVIKQAQQMLKECNHD